jgi:CubicO group peptidase (beta-lactamase class C family)
MRKRVLVIGIISMVIVVLDVYFHPYEKSIPHKPASVTKSFTTTLIGIAADRGEISLDQPLVPFFPDRAAARNRPGGLGADLSVRPQPG